MPHSTFTSSSSFNKKKYKKEEKRKLININLAYIIVQAWGLSSLNIEAKASSDATATE